MRRRLKMESGLRKQMPHIGAVNVRLIVGLLVVVLGVLFLISNLHIVDIASPMRYFGAAVFLSIGFSLVIEHRSDRSWQWGLGWIFAGLWTFAYQRRWIEVNFMEFFVPLLMLAGGAYLVRRALSERAEQDQSPTSPEASSASLESTSGATTRNTTYSGNVVHGVGVLSSSEQKPATMQRADLFALMGGVKLDLFDTQLINNNAVIHLAACMGGIEIYAPSEWTVINRVVPVMGAFVDKRRPAAAIPTGDAVKTLSIDGFVLMGGVEIKN